MSLKHFARLQLPPEAETKSGLWKGLLHPSAVEGNG